MAMPELLGLTRQWLQFRFPRCEQLCSLKSGATPSNPILVRGQLWKLASCLSLMKLGQLLMQASNGRIRRFLRHRPALLCALKVESALAFPAHRPNPFAQRATGPRPP